MTRPKYTRTCHICGQEVGVQGFKKHLASHARRGETAPAPETPAASAMFALDNPESPVPTEPSSGGGDDTYVLVVRVPKQALNDALRMMIPIGELIDIEHHV